jgi:uncharacterized membrane protein
MVGKSFRSAIPGHVMTPLFVLSVSGLVFLAIGVYHVQQDIYPNRAFWPAGLLACGLALMIAASNYALMGVALSRFKRK